MFGRVAACGIAALFLAMPVPSSGETNASLDAQLQAAALAIAMPPEPDQAQPQDPAPVPAQEQSEDDSQAQAKVAALDPAEPADRLPPVAQPFGLDVVPVISGGLLAKWAGVEADIRAENEVLSRCRSNADACPAAARTFLDIVAQGRAHTGRARIGIINRAINMAIQPMSDLAQWGVIDRWSAPLETLTTGRGDCEDYAIAKYEALRQAGVAAPDLRLVIVRNLAAGEDHAVVAARLDGDWLILDNRWLTLVQDSEMLQAIPLFVLDETGVKRFAPAIAPELRHASAPRQGAVPAPASL